MPLNKPWTVYQPGSDRHLPGNLGVYEIGDAGGTVLYIGYAGGRTRFGLRERIPAHFSDRETNPVLRGRAHAYRYEVNQMYLTRWIDLHGRHKDEHGRVPEGNEASGEPLPEVARRLRAGSSSP